MGRVKLARPLLFVALTALVAMSARGSVPTASAPLGVERPRQLAALIVSTAPDDSSLEPIGETPRFELGGASLLDEPRAEVFHLVGAELLSEEQHRVPPQSYPETRVWAIDFLGSTLVSRSTELSLESHWACGDLSCGIASDGREDPLGLWTAGEIWDIAVDTAKGSAIDVGHGVANVATAGVYGGIRRAQARGEIDGSLKSYASAGAQGVANLASLGLYGTMQETLEEGGTVKQGLKTWAGDVSGYTDIAEGGTKLGEGEYLEGAGRIAGGTGKMAGWLVGGAAAYSKATNQPLMAFGKNLGGAGTYRDANGRLRDAKTNGFVKDPKTSPAPEVADGDSVHANSHQTKKPAQGYTLTDRDSGEPLKYGETTRGEKRYSRKFLKDQNARMEFGPSGSKKDMHQWQHNQIEDYKAATGTRPPLNKNDY